jgi:hypothetical protein
VAHMHKGMRTGFAWSGVEKSCLFMPTDELGEEEKREREQEKAAIYTQGAAAYVRTPGLAYRLPPGAMHVLVSQVATRFVTDGVVRRQ